MSLTEADFLRTLAHAFEDSEIQVTRGAVQIDTHAGIVEFALEPQAPHTIASLSMPVLKVTIDLDGLQDDGAKEFMRQFNRAFHRGGG